MHPQQHRLTAVFHCCVPDNMSSFLSGPSAAPGLQLVLPGATVPWADLPAIWIAAALSMAVHEAGHALAAGAEGVPLQGIGFAAPGLPAPACLHSTPGNYA